MVGCAGLGGAWSPVDLAESVEAILYALEKGVSNLDMAPAYMDAELAVAKALNQWPGSPPHLSTKVGKDRGRADEAGLNNYKYDAMKASILKSIERLGRQVDLLYLHEPNRVPPDRIPFVIDYLLEFKSQGFTLKLGLGGDVPATFHPFINDGIFDVVMDFNRFNLLVSDALVSDFPFFRSCGLEIHEASPLMMGLLGNRLKNYLKNPPEWIDQSVINRAKMALTLAENIGFNISTLSHRYLFFNPVVDKVVVGPRTFQQLRSTLEDWNQGPLSEEIIYEIESLKNE